MGGYLPPVRKCPGVPRRFYLARGAILTRVAGFGKNVVAFSGLWSWGGFFGIGPPAVKCFWENRGIAHKESSLRYC
jgi:hypothetical protein